MKRPQQQPVNLSYYNVAVDFGYTLLAGCGLLGYGGYWLDRRWGTSPGLLITGVLLGLAVGFKRFFTELGRIERARKESRQHEEHPPDTPECK